MNNQNLEKLIIDRTLNDIAEKSPKGFYNVQDIQRINSYITYLSDELNLNLVVDDIILGEALTKQKLNNIIDNVNKIRSVWYVAETTPPTPVLSNSWDYNKANNIEKILLALDEFMQSVKIDKLYCGTFSAGNQIKFRG